MPRAHRPKQGAAFDGHRSLGKANVGRRQVARARQLVPGDVVLCDQDRPRAELLGQGDGDRPADRIEQRDPSVRQRRAAVYVGNIDDHRGVIDVVLAPACNRAGALDDHVAARCRPSFGDDRDAETSTFCLQPRGQRRAGPGDRRKPTDAIRLLEHRDTMPAECSDACGLQPGNTAADHDDIARCGRRHVPVGVLGLASCRRLADTADDRVADVAYLARLVASDARSDGVGSIGHELGHQIGLGDLGSGHLHGIANAVADCPLALTPLDHRSLKEDRCRRHRRLDRAAHVDVEAGRLVEVGSGLFCGVDRTAHDHEVVDAGRDEHGRDLWRHLRRDPRPRRQFVAAQAQSEQQRVRSHGLDDLASEEQAVLPPCIVAMVRQARQELAHQAVLAGVDLDTVAAGLPCNRRASRKSGDHRLDVGGLHPLRRLAAVDLRDARRGPQRLLVVGTAALAAGVIERGDHEGAVRVAGLGDRSPTGPARPRERRPVVRPIAVVHAGAFGDDDTATSCGSSGVVRGMPRREAACVVAEVCDVRPEHHSIDRLARAERQRVQQQHDAVSLAVRRVAGERGRSSARPARCRCWW